MVSISVGFVLDASTLWSIHFTVCLPGYYDSNGPVAGGNCLACPDGTYKTGFSDQDMSSCISCSDTMSTTEAMGSTSPSDCCEFSKSNFGNKQESTLNDLTLSLLPTTTTTHVLFAFFSVLGRLSDGPDCWFLSAMSIW